MFSNTEGRSAPFLYISHDSTCHDRAELPRTKWTELKYFDSSKILVILLWVEPFNLGSRLLKGILNALLVQTEMKG